MLRTRCIHPSHPVACGSIGLGSDPGDASRCWPEFAPLARPIPAHDMGMKMRTTRFGRAMEAF